MIGEKVPREQLVEILLEEKRKDNRVKDLGEELKTLKPGQCLVYDAKAGMAPLLGLSIDMFHIRDLKLIVRPDKVYAYKEC